MSWDELSSLFKDSVADALPAATMTKVIDLVAALDGNARPRALVRAFSAAPDWLERDD